MTNIISTLEKLQLAEFYSYATCVCDRIYEVEDDHNWPGYVGNNIDKRQFKIFDEFFTRLRIKAAEISGENEDKYLDNKVAFKLVDPKNGTTLWVGWKDDIYSVGLHLNRLGVGSKYDFNEKKWTVLSCDYETI